MSCDISDRLLGVVERAADVEATPSRRAVTAQPQGPGDRIEGAAELEGGRCHDDCTIVKHLVAHQHRHTHRRDLQQGATTRVLAHPGDVELALLQDSLGVLEDLIDRRTSNLAGTVVVLGRCRLQLGLYPTRRVPHPCQGQGQGLRYAVQSPLGQLVDNSGEELGGIGDLIGAR